MNKADVVTVIKAINPYIRIDKDAMINALLTNPLDDISTELDTLVENALLSYAWRDIESDNAGILPHWIKATITTITHKKSSSGNPTWYCELKSDDDTVDGMTLYLGTSNGYANEAKQVYPQIDLMSIGDVVNDVNITVYVTKSDRFLEMQKIVPGGRFEYEHESDNDRKARIVRDALLTIPKKAIFLDVETNGLDDSAEIVQFASRSWDSAGEFKTYINPQDAHKLLVKGRGGKSASDINGITPDMLEGKAEFPYIYEHNLKSLLTGKTIVTYGDFDVRMLNQVCERHGLEPLDFEHVDLMKIYAEYNGEVTTKGYKSKKLTDAYKAIVGQELDGAHEAMNDVKAMIEIVEALTKEAMPF